MRQGHVIYRILNEQSGQLLKVAGPFEHPWDAMDWLDEREGDGHIYTAMAWFTGISELDLPFIAAGEDQPPQSKLDRTNRAIYKQKRKEAQEKAKQKERERNLKLARLRDAERSTG